MTSKISFTDIQLLIYEFVLLPSKGRQMQCSGKVGQIMVENNLMNSFKEFTGADKGFRKRGGGGPANC